MNLFSLSIIINLLRPLRVQQLQIRIHLRVCSSDMRAELPREQLFVLQDRHILAVWGLWQRVLTWIRYIMHTDPNRLRCEDEFDSSFNRLRGEDKLLDFDIFIRRSELRLIVGCVCDERQEIHCRISDSHRLVRVAECDSFVDIPWRDDFNSIHRLEVHHVE